MAVGSYDTMMDMQEDEGDTKAGAPVEILKEDKVREGRTRS